MSTQMLHRIQKTIAGRHLLAPREHVLVAVSGGPDSVALLHALHALQSRYALSLTVAHLHHGIRGKRADADARFVGALARRLGLRCVQARCDAPRLARRDAVSLEMAARQARYAFLARAARRVGATVVATAHTADDQAEPVLLKLARGAGPQGLSGIPYATTSEGVKVVRPLLDCSKSDLIAFLRDGGWKWREDETNRDAEFLRNRVRNEILPLLEARLNPQIRRALVRTADLFREENRWVDALARKILNDCRVVPRRRPGTPPAALDPALRSERLVRYPRGARRRVLRLWLSENGIPAEAVDYDSVDRVERLLCERHGSTETALAAGWIVKSAYGRLTLQRARETPSAPFRKVLRIPGETALARPGLRVTTAIAPGLVKDRARGPGHLPARCSLAAAAADRRIMVLRSWRPGDRMRPLGLNGSKKVQDIFTDAKVPEDERARIPLLECRGQIVWLPGYRVAEGWEVKDCRASALHIRVERL